MSQLRAARASETDRLRAIINAAAAAYRGAIPDDCWHTPYMSRAALADELAAGVRLCVATVDDAAVAVMGVQDRGAVALLRHAYVLPAAQRRGHGARLLAHCSRSSALPLLVGTWAAATWAIDFYRAHGFRLLDADSTERLLVRYWTVPARQRAHSVVLADARWSPAGAAAGH
ncbi:MAG: GNAT family N-acetyltransferase [Gammaproteobacteria bacterium]